MILSRTVEYWTVVLGPMDTWGPMMAFFSIQPAPIVTGGTIMEFSFCTVSWMVLPFFFSSSALVSRRVSLRPQSYHVFTLNDLNLIPRLIIHSNASVRLYSPWVLMFCANKWCRHSYKKRVSFIL